MAVRDYDSLNKTGNHDPHGQKHINEKSDQEQDIFIVSKYLPTKCLLIIKGKEQSNSMVENPGKHQLYQEIKANIITKERN